MPMSAEQIATIMVAIFASSGFWTFLTTWIARKDDKKSQGSKELELQSKILKGLGHDRICSLGETYLTRLPEPYITRDEYENLHDYLYIPYKNLGGNGTAEKIMNEIKKLPVKNKTGGN